MTVYMRLRNKGKVVCGLSWEIEWFVWVYSLVPHYIMLFLAPYSSNQEQNSYSWPPSPSVSHSLEEKMMNEVWTGNKMMPLLEYSEQFFWLAYLSCSTGIMEFVSTRDIYLYIIQLAFDQISSWVCVTVIGMLCFNILLKKSIHGLAL